ncbi:MAG TPA: glycoside hydrolase family 15 protein [Candidatus Saccharimonadales bacterium]|nr:glycoside hydrolase family 15 protein [Candidatus Saccharimonadales bacterium]
MTAEQTFNRETLENLIQSSAKVISKYQQPSGAYPASPNFQVYNYCWLRDGSFTADAMSRAGHLESAEAFFSWCSDIINSRRESILAGSNLDARYTYDGRESNENWETFQLDGYGTLLWAMKQHENRHGRDVGKYQDAAGLVQHYLATKWQEPSIDWWEERKGRHAASLACVYAGLSSYGHPEASSVHDAIDLLGERTDASLLACETLGAVEADLFAPTSAKIEQTLVGQDGGVFRYREDTYYGGGEWPLLAGFLGWHYVRTGRISEAQNKLKWIQDQTQANGWIPEQVQSIMLHPESYHEWVLKWGKPANPLLWSQAMMITLASELLDNLE